MWHRVPVSRRCLLFMDVGGGYRWPAVSTTDSPRRFTELSVEQQDVLGDRSFFSQTGAPIEVPVVLERGSVLAVQIDEMPQWTPARFSFTLARYRSNLQMTTALADEVLAGPRYAGLQFAMGLQWPMRTASVLLEHSASDALSIDVRIEGESRLLFTSKLLSHQRVFIREVRTTPPPGTTAASDDFQEPSLQF